MEKLHPVRVHLAILSRESNRQLAHPLHPVRTV